MRNITALHTNMLFPFTENRAVRRLVVGINGQRSRRGYHGVIEVKQASVMSALVREYYLLTCDNVK